MLGLQTLRIQTICLEQDGSRLETISITEAVSLRTFGERLCGAIFLKHCGRQYRHMLAHH